MGTGPSHELVGSPSEGDVELEWSADSTCIERSRQLGGVSSMLRGMNEREIREVSDLNYREALREMSRRSGGAVSERDGLLLTAIRHPHPTMNTAIRLDSELPAATAIERARAFYDQLGHSFGFATLADPRDDDLRKAGAAAGLAELMSPPAMVVEQPIPEAALPNGVEVRIVETDYDVRDFADVAARSWCTYGLPREVPEAVFAKGASVLAPHIIGAIAYRENRAVACALVVLTHGIGGVYWVSTVEDARGLGLGETITRTVTNVGFERGARLVSLQASPMGEPIYRRMGYREIFKYTTLIAVS